MSYHIAAHPITSDTQRADGLVRSRSFSALGPSMKGKGSDRDSGSLLGG